MTRSALLAVLALSACGGADASQDASQDASLSDAATADAATADAGAAPPSPMPNLPGAMLPNEQRHEILSPTLVRDAITGLVWQRGEQGALRTQAEALADCDALVLDGRDDFRLPSRIEWVSLLEPARSPAIDPISFPSAAAEYHWTSSRSPIGADSAYSVYLGGGETTIGIATRASARVRCVAGGASLDGAPLVVEGDRVRDRRTGLVWSLAAQPASSWDEASASCSGRGGRLPSLRELQTIIDETRANPAIDRAAFPDASSGRHWTSTLRDAGEVLPWTVDFGDGQTFADELQSALRASRCVFD